MYLLDAARGKSELSSLFGPVQFLGGRLRPMTWVLDPTTHCSRSSTLVIIRIRRRAFIVHEVIRPQRRRNRPERDRRLGKVETVGEIVGGCVRVAPRRQ